MQTLALDLTKTVALHAQYVDGGRYERDARHLCLTTSKGSLPFGSADLENGGARKPFPFARAELHWTPFTRADVETFDTRMARWRTWLTRMGTGKEPLPSAPGSKSKAIAAYTVTDATAVRAAFDYTLTDQGDGPGRLDIWGYNAAGTPHLYMSFGAWIDRNGTAKDSSLFFTQNSNFSWIHPGPSAGVRAVPAEWVIVPKLKSDIAPRMCPLPKGRSILPVPTIDYRKLTRIAVQPGLSNDTLSNYRPVLTNRGIVVDDHKMLYFISEDMTDAKPRHPMVDGTRGKASSGMFTFLEPGRNWKRLWFEPLAGGLTEEDGTRHTLFGLISKNQALPRYWEHATWDDYDLVGVYPPGLTKQECVIRECWGWRFWLPSLALDMQAAPVGGEQPHVGVGPVSFAMSADGWIWKIQQNGGGPEGVKAFGNNDRFAPAILTRWAKTNGGWGLFVVGDEIIVTERNGHEISAWSVSVPNTKLRTIIKNPNGALFGSIVGRGWRATQSLAACQAQDILAPEGLTWLYPPAGRPLSEGWLIFGSIAQQDVRRIRLDGTGLEFVCEPNFTGNSSFLTLDVSQYMPDGTGEFGAPGTVFTTTWEINHLGRPQAWAPQPGVSKTGRPLTNGDWGYVVANPKPNVDFPRDRAEIGLSRNAYDAPEGAGGAWESDGYGAAIGIGPGRYSNGTSSVGQHDYVGSLPTDVVPDGAIMLRAADKCRELHMWEVYGPNFHGWNGNEPLPWGLDPDIDAYMKVLGFSQEVVMPPPVDPPPVVVPPVATPPATQGSVVNFKSLTKTAATGYPPLPVTGQRVVMALPGSSGSWNTSDPDPNSPRYVKGDEYTAYDDDDIRSELTVASGGAYGSTLKPPTVIPYIKLSPVDRTIMGLGKPAESWNSGYRRGPDKIFVPHTERAYREWINRLKPMFPQADWDKGIVIADSNSAGAGGAVMWGMLQPEVCAVYASQPQWVRIDAWVWELNAREAKALPPDLKLDDGALFSDRYNMIPYLADPANRMPNTLQWCKATADQFSAFTQDKAAVAALRARNRNPATLNSQRVHICVHWVPGGHGAPGIYITPSSAKVDTDWQDWRGYELGKGSPVFDNYSFDDDINTAASGWINRGLRFRNVVESAAGWSCEVTSTLGACAVDVLPRSDVFTATVTAQHVTIPAALSYVPVSFSAVVTPPPPPPATPPTVDSFTASAAQVPTGSLVTLDWQTTDATAVTITTLDDEPVDGSAGVVPALGDNVYTLTATGPGGTTTATVTVNARPLTLDERVARLETVATSHGWTL